MRPYLETFFRTPILVILPALLVPLIVVSVVTALTWQYRTAATVWVEEEQGAFYANGETPAGLEAEAFSQRLATDAFRNSVIERAGLTPAIQSLTWPGDSRLVQWVGDYPVIGSVASAVSAAAPTNVDDAFAAARAEVGASLVVEASGRNLITVTYAGDDAAIGTRVLDAAVHLFMEESLATDITRADQVVTFFEGERRDRLVEMERARLDLQNYQATLPFFGQGLLTPEQEVRLTELRRVYEDAVVRHADARRKLDEATSGQQETLIQRRTTLSLVDAPLVPGSRSLDIAGAMGPGLMGLVFGAAIGGVLIVFRTWLDRSLRRPEDVQNRLRVRVLGTIPDVRKRRVAG